MASGLCMGMAVGLAQDALAEEGERSQVRFNTQFIHGGTTPPDIEAFMKGNDVSPGLYRVDVYINRVSSGRHDIRFVQNPATTEVGPCITAPMLLQAGVSPQRLPEAGDGDACVDLSKAIEYASVTYLPGSLRLEISIPQAALSRSVRGGVPVEQWEGGEAAVFSSYSLNASRREQALRTSQQHYLGLRNGLNLQGWRLRNDSALTDGNHQSRRFTSNRTFVQHDVTPLKSQFTAGQTYSDPQLFDSVRFRGVSLASDDAMLSDSERIYAPIIRGIADTNATVEVRQNGFLLYSGQVAPGPFELNDVYPGGNGDLQVTIIEADGRRHGFLHAYAALPLMLPPGQMRYSLAAGNYDRNGDGGASPRLGMGTLAYGVSDRVTMAGGVQFAEDYNAANLGAGFNTGMGALSLDVTRSSSRQSPSTLTGQSTRLRYASTRHSTSTAFAIAGYRYSTERYRSLDEHVRDLQSSADRGAQGRARDRVELSVTQAVPGYASSLSLTASQQRNWNDAGATRQLYLAWSGAWNSVSYSVSVEDNRTRLRSGTDDADRRIAVSFTFPLGTGVDTPRLSFNAVGNGRGQHDTQLGISGRLPVDRHTYYSVMAGHDSRNGQSGHAAVDSTRSFGRFQGGYGQGAGYRSYNLGASGSVVAHGSGVNFGQYLGETFALVEVPGVKDVAISSHANVRTAENGYAVVPFAQPYRSNWVNLDTRTVGAEVELENATGQTVPRRGAMPVVRFGTSVGRRVQFHLTLAEGGNLPFGARVRDAGGRELAVVDPRSHALALVEQEAGQVRVVWSQGECLAQYQLPERDPARVFERVEAVCR